ncbi:RNA-splicing ligase RtcB (plasmid) [Aureibacter tunicatorum]|nr:RNA-splicing ligase RtcB [Aureibacter tunicatorum]
MLNAYLSDNQSKSIALGILNRQYKKHDITYKLDLISKIIAKPQDYLDDPIWSKLANSILPKEVLKTEEDMHELKDNPSEFSIFGKKEINSNAIQQMKVAMSLPVAEKGALMPDAHQGYGLPIGGVLATKNEIIPYAVGVDIGCRMSLSLYDLPENYIHRYEYNLKKALKEHTAFGTSQCINYAQEHEILDRREFHESSLLKGLHQKACKQIGSSGGGNHFVEWGIVEIDADNTLGITEGKYIGIMAHSGSRGLGATIAQHFTQIAKSKCKLPKSASHLAWLDINSSEGHEYWIAMNLAGDYAKACHDRIHANLSKAMGIKPFRIIENHHNFAWKEKLENQEEFIIHRKGATPAHEGQSGIIPGTMISPAYIVSGKGNTSSLNSASHGAGRSLSRTKAKSSITKSAMKGMLKHTGVTLLGAGVDEAPIVYKDIDKIMSHQNDLVKIEGKFFPKIVRMAKD